MNLRDLSYIIAVDELKSFIKASKKCFVSQPALSMQIQKIEDTLGIKLFERSRKNIITTPEGEKFLFLAREIVANVETMKALKHEIIQLKIGIIHTIAPYLLLKIILSLQTELKDVKLFFTEGKTKELIENLEDGKLDLVIFSATNDSKQKAPNFIHTELYQEPFYLCTPKKKFSFTKNGITEEELGNLLKQEKLILLEEGNCMADELNIICKLYNSSKIRNKSSESDFYATSIETIKHMVRLGNGISILPKLSISTSDKDLSYFKLPHNESRNVGSLFRKNTLKNNLIERINNLIKRKLKNISKD
jgi:LysR family hydrogen peroxide-inducible transcriptional activator